MTNQTDRTYLLDTSALRALSSAKLENCHLEGIRLAASAYCFLELLTHLEDPGHFGVCRGNLVKFAYVEVLDDPWASVQRAVTSPEDDIHARFDGWNDLARAIIPALRESSTLAHLYRTQVHDSRGRLRDITQSAKIASDTLAIEEGRYQEYVHNVMALVRNGAVTLSTPAERHNGTLSIIYAWRQQLGHRMPESDERIWLLVLQTYIYSAYVLHSALDYLERKAPRVDPNDFEDAKFCNHLGLDSRTTAVTNDRRMKGRLESTLALLRSQPETLWHPEIEVIGVPDFEKLIAPSARANRQS